jgi:hypothetical protein
MIVSKESKELEDLFLVACQSLSNQRCLEDSSREELFREIEKTGATDRGIAALAAVYCLAYRKAKEEECDWHRKRRACDDERERESERGPNE